MLNSSALSKCINAPYINREYSWLQFNKRVLEQAKDKTNPLLERGRFLSIFISNLDEFIRVRLGSMINIASSHKNYAEDKTGMTAQEQIDAILSMLPELYTKSERVYSTLRKELRVQGLNILTLSTITESQKKKAFAYFEENIASRLSPLVLDAKHPMIRFENQRVCLVLALERDGRTMFGVVPMAHQIGDIVPIPGGKNHINAITAELLLYLFGDTFFPNCTIKEKVLVRVTRNADFKASVEDADIEYDFDFSKLIKNKVENRSNLNAVRLEIQGTASEAMKTFLIKQLEIKKKQCFEIKGCFSYKFMFKLDSFFPVEKRLLLRSPQFKGTIPHGLNKGAMIKAVMNKDIFLAYPFNSIDPLLWLLDECAEDERVTNINITIYRLASHSSVVSSLMRAAEKGKAVTVVVELQARFDEENNLYYARQLQEAGCTVIYGIEDLKVHSKIISIVLAEGDRVEYITHLGTGNYNEDTSKQYTDLNIITSNKEIGVDGVTFFQNLATLNLDYVYNKLLIAPVTLKSGIIECIDKEIAKGKEGLIVFKMNSLTDKLVIDKLIEASQKGVTVKLIIRGICCLLPNIVGLTENISVLSIVGRFLEHSRIYSFGSGTMYISSADMMTRNTDRRVEIATPVLDSTIKATINKMLDIILSDNVKGRVLNKEGKYLAISSNEEKINSQESLLSMFS